MDTFFKLNQIREFFQGLMDEPAWIFIGTSTETQHTQLKIGTADGKTIKTYAADHYTNFGSNQVKGVIEQAHYYLRMKLEKPTQVEIEKAFLETINEYKGDLSSERMQQLMNEKFAEQLVDE